MTGRMPAGLRGVFLALLLAAVVPVLAQTPAPGPSDSTAASPEATATATGAPQLSAPAAIASPDGAPPAAATPAPSGEGKIKTVLSEAPIDRLVGTLSQQSGKNVVSRGKTAGQRVTLITKDVTLERALDMVVNSKPNWLWYKPEDQPNTYEIWDQDSFKAEVLPRQVRSKVFIPREITAEEANKAISSVLTPNIGVSSFDPRSNKVIVTDLPYVLEMVQRLIEQIDVKFITRVFYIAHAEVSSILEKLTNLKSPAAPQPEVDERTHQIIVRDRIEIIRQMELLVQTLDVGPEMRVYDLNNLEFEGQGRQDIEEAIDQVITEGAFKMINNQSGKMIVEDVPEVHEKIEKILAAFDQPAKQVLLEAEIVETEFKEGLAYGSEWVFSQDLFSSVIDKLVSGGSTDSGTGGSGDATAAQKVAAIIAGVQVPTGSQTPITNENLGFLNFRDEFPIASMGGLGINSAYLTKHAYVSFKAAMSDSRSRILQQPRALVKNQKEVLFSVGQKVPFFTGGSYNYYNNNTANSNYYSGGPQQSLISVGLELAIRPTINNNGLIEMEVEISNNTAFEEKKTFANQTYDAVGTNNQELQSTLIVPSGETRVIGGLVSEEKAETKAGIPGLVKIPVVGPLLFGTTSKPSANNRRRNLLVFITPTIVMENPGDLHKYKGRVVSDKSHLDSFTTPSATLSDIRLEPMVPDLPAGTQEVERPIGELPGDRVMREEGVVKRDTGRDVPQEEQPTETPTRRESVVDLQHVKIDEESTSGVDALMRPDRIAGPSGALTGEAAKGSAAGAARTPAPGSATPPPRGPVGAPPPPPVRTPIPVTPPPSVPVPPRTETRM